MKYGDPQSGEFKDITIKVSDTSPIGIEAEYNGTVVPNGWEEVDDVVVTENVVSRNIFNGLLELGNYNENGAKTTSDGIYRNINMIYIKPNMQYTFSIDGIGRNYVVLFYDIDKNFISSISTVDYSVTSPVNAYYMNFRCYIADFTSNFKNLKLQIEKGTSATNYTPYLNMQELEKKTRITSENIAINDFFTSSTKTITDYSIVKIGNIINIQRMVIPSIPKGETRKIAQVNHKYKPKGGKPIRILASVGGASAINGILLINGDSSVDIQNTAETANLNAYIFNATYIIDEEATI